MGMLFTNMTDESPFEFEGVTYNIEFIDTFWFIGEYFSENLQDDSWDSAYLLRGVDSRSTADNFAEFEEHLLLGLRRKIHYKNGSDEEDLYFKVENEHDALSLIQNLDYSRPYFRIFKNTYDTTVETFNERV